MATISVIGAGIGGMSAAARLAKAGHQVTVYENSDRAGGKCRTEWFGDYAFDTGPSLLTLPAVYRDLFLKTGKRIEHILDIKPVDPAFNYHFSDGSSVLFPNLSNPNTYAEIEKSYGLAASNQWKEIINRAERMWEVSREPFIESELKSIFSLLKRRSLLRDVKEIAPFTSLAVLLTIAFVESTFGAWHIQGGVGQLSVALEQRCIELGVNFKFNTLVKEILIKNNKTTGIKTIDGVEIKSDLVVANSDAEYIYNQLISKNVSGARSERRKIKLATKSLSGFSLLLGLDNSKGKAVSIDHHNVYFPSNYDSEFDDIFTKQIPVKDPTIYICAPKDPLMTKGENKEAWFVLVNAPRHQVDGGWDWRHGGAEYAQKIIQKLDHLGLNVSPRLDFMKYRTPADLENYAMAPGGSIYGSSSNSAISAFLRTKNRSKIKGLFCVGGSSHPGGGLPLVGISAEIVANAIGKA